MTIPVVLLNFNSADDCRKCVGYLKKQTNIELEIIIVDNASNPEDVREVEELCKTHGLTFIQARENRGYNAGNNIGLRYAADKGYKYALLANPDMEFPDENFVIRLTQEMERHPEVVVMGTEVLTPEGIHQNPKYRGEESWKNSFDWMKALLRKPDKTQTKESKIPEWVDRPEESHYCRCLNGCCLMLSLSFLKKINFFDERTFLYGEEPILGRKVEMEGGKMYYFADLSCVHDHKKSREGSPAFCNKHWRHSQLIYIRHYSGQPFYGRCVAELSSRLYFMLLNLKHRLR